MIEEQELEYKERVFNNEDLRIEALTHKSYTYENPMEGNHNERLEFLGDAIISFTVADYLHGRFEKLSEGQLTLLRARLVCRQTLSQFALRLGLDNHLRLGLGAISSGARNNEKVLEDTFEAYMGAIFLDSNKDYSEVMRFMEPLLTPKVDKLIAEGIVNNAKNRPLHRPMVGPIDESAASPHEDPINKLQTWSQRRGFGIPQYNEIEKVGASHTPQFTFDVVINGEVYGKGTARSKKDAKKQAALNALTERAVIKSEHNSERV